jgi:hypothetical protein
VTEIRRWLESTWAQGITLFLVLAALAAGTGFQVQASHRERCVERWADATSARAQYLTSASTRRSDALDSLLLVAGQQNQAQTAVAYQRYLEASRQYKQAVVDHPPPDPPKLRC